VKTELDKSNKERRRRKATVLTSREMNELTEKEGDELDRVGRRIANIFPT